MNNSMDVKECSALGRSGYLGAFYDAREDKFCHGSLFNTFNLPDTSVNRVDVDFCNIEISFEDSYTKRFEKLDVNCELRASLFAGLLNVQGSGKYLTDDKSSSRSVKGTMLYSIRTKQENVNIYHEELKTFISLEALKSASTTATHFIGGIVWGANTFASLECRKTRHSDLTSISGDMKSELEKMCTSIQGQGDARYEGLNESASYSFEIKVYGDVIPGDEELPKNKKEAIALIRKTPKYIANCNGGMGKPITFHLYPLKDVMNMMDLGLTAHAVSHAIDEATIMETEQIFNDLLVAKRTLNDFYEDMSSSQAPHFAPLVVHEVSSYKNNLEINESLLRNKIREALVLARTNPEESTRLQLVMREYSNTEFCPTRIRELVEKWKIGGVQEKIDFVNNMRAQKAVYCKSKTFGVDSVRTKNKNFYALVFQENDQLFASDMWKQNYDLFVQLLTNPTEETADLSFFVIEMVNSYQNLRVPKDVCVYHCVDGEIESEDLLLNIIEKSSFSWAKSSEVEVGFYKPNRSSLVKTRCPGSIYARCGHDVVQWKCNKDKCLADLYYGYDGYIYCDCGKAKLTTFSYKCSDKKHGFKWIKFENVDDVTNMMEKLKPPEEINILILGETGVGKSTFVNAFTNYLSFSDLDDAESQELIGLIPTSFTVTDEDYLERHITFGEDANESGQRGGSQTQSCKSYTFPSGDRLIRLIDTPGIGDTAGVDKDMKNFENILNYIMNYSVLHGICILLKPNNSRISVMFRFCIQELLCHIHRSASENIVFLFTNARGTFYRPGDTLPSLRALLQENETKVPYVQIALNKETIYCLDNEAFRFLVAVKNGITFPEDEKENFRSSWDRSVKECSRVLEHFSKIKPHLIRDTISLNEARKLIIFLSKPLCDISQNIQTNIGNIIDQESKIQKAGEDIAKLMGELYVPVTALKAVNFDQPRTVCTSSKCSTIRTIGDKRVKDFTQICHNPCEVSNVTADIVNNPELLKCWAMIGRYCRVCGCSYDVHMHIYYENEEVEEQQIDSGVQEQIKNKEDAKLAKQNILHECQVRKDKLEREQKHITLASAQFAHFLRNNAITPYNDALKDYLQHLIVVERQKCAYDPENRRIVADLSKMKAAYEEQVNILEQNFEAATNEKPFSITPDTIKDTIRTLYSLEISGNFIREAVENQGLVRAIQVAMFNEKMYKPRRYACKRPGKTPKPSHGHGQQPGKPKKGVVQKIKNALQDFFDDDPSCEEAFEHVGYY